MDLLGKEVLKEMYKHLYVLHFERSLFLDKKDFIALGLSASATVLLTPANSVDFGHRRQISEKRGKVVECTLIFVRCSVLVRNRCVFLHTDTTQKLPTWFRPIQCV